MTADDRNYSVTTEIEPGRMVLKSSTPGGEAQEEMPAVLDGETEQKIHRLRFNSRYLQDFLQVVSRSGSPIFAFGFNDSCSPFELFLPADRNGYRFVLMPLRNE